METVRAYSDVHMAFCFVGIVVMSYAAAFIVSVCVEFPMMQLEKLVFKNDRWNLTLLKCLYLTLLGFRKAHKHKYKPTYAGAVKCC